MPLLESSRKPTSSKRSLRCRTLGVVHSPKDIWLTWAINLPSAIQSRAKRGVLHVRHLVFQLGRCIVYEELVGQVAKVDVRIARYYAIAHAKVLPGAVYGSTGIS